MVLGQCHYIPRRSLAPLADDDARYQNPGVQLPTGDFVSIPLGSDDKYGFYCEVPLGQNFRHLWQRQLTGIIESGSAITMSHIIFFFMFDVGTHFAVGDVGTINPKSMQLLLDIEKTDTSGFVLDGDPNNIVWTDVSGGGKIKTIGVNAEREQTLFDIGFPAEFIDYAFMYPLKNLGATTLPGKGSSANRVLTVISEIEPIFQAVGDTFPQGIPLKTFLYMVDWENSRYRNNPNGRYPGPKFHNKYTTPTPSPGGTQDSPHDPDIRFINSPFQTA